MNKVGRIIKYLSFIIKKLRYLGLIILVLNLVIVFLFNRLMFKLPLWVPLLVVFIPVLSFLCFFFINQIGSKFCNNMAHYKYNLYFPFYFHDDPVPERSKRIDIDAIKSKIQPCDIVLRRYHYYIDGLIFSENSYFTHAGIYCDDYKGISSQVLHAEAEPGVHMTPLEEFCNCDDIAILRFSFRETEEEKDMREYLKNEHRSLSDAGDIRRQEELVFENLLKRTKSENGNFILKDNALYAEGYSNLVLDRAISLIDTPYDLKFDFDNFDRLSCIEYVWYCFKFLFPLHRIRAKDFEFFKLIKMPVIVPDVFVRNDFFSYVYSSVPIAVKNKKELMNYAKSDQKQFFKFVGMIWIWDLVFLALFYLLFRATGRIPH